MMDQVNAGVHHGLAATGTALPEDAELVELFARTRADSGRTMLSLLDERPMLLVFLRPFGSPASREALADVARARPDLEKRGVRPVFVHMATPERATAFFQRFKLSDVERVSDPTTALYQAPVFHLLKTTVLPEFLAGQHLVELATRALWRYGMGPAGKEDATQLPGVFFIRDRVIRKAFRHKTAAERPDYARFGA
ncbi:MAG TPA: AhpC/TSA family protein [Acidobacteriaceae bacterium]